MLSLSLLFFFVKCLLVFFLIFVLAWKMIILQGEWSVVACILDPAC
jgi:hypothetical protein